MNGCDRPVYLLTPGPLTTSKATKQAMLRDWGSRDAEFKEMTATVRRKLLELIGDTQGEFECVPLQGSGTFAVEAMLGTLVGPDDKALVLVNGAYGKRAAKILDRIGRRSAVLETPESLPPRGREIAAAIKRDSQISHVVAIHCETSSGMLNPLDEIAAAVRSSGRKLLVDCMSSFGALPLSAAETPFEAVACSANKCFEGVPGFGFVIVRRTALSAAKGHCHSLCLDLHDQWAGFEANSQWRFTPPTHVIAAFLEAIIQLESEGGVEARRGRYSRNRDVLVSGMRRLGFRTLLDDDLLSPIIVTFLNPAHPEFDFETLYCMLKSKGFVIYPGKLSEADSFRIGCIGAIDEKIMRQAVNAVQKALVEMGVDDASPCASDR